MDNFFDYYYDIGFWDPEITCVKNKDLLTNFDNCQLDTYRVAIHLYKKVRPDVHLWIRDDAYARNDAPLGPNSKALILDGKGTKGDMGPFWRIYDRLRDDESYLQRELNRMNRKQKMKCIISV